MSELCPILLPQSGSLCSGSLQHRAQFVFTPAALFGIMDKESERRYGMLPEKTGIRAVVLEQIRSIAEQYDLCSVILFGSRARGDFKERSDIDLAVSGGNTSAFALAIDEETDTLLKYDIVNLDRPVDTALLDNIRKDGIILYEKV